jgi:hypothetical protein
VRQKLTTFAQVLGIGLLITNSSLGIAAPDAVPKLNTRPSCESSARAALFPDRSVESCLRQEQEAHRSLLRHWPQYNKADRTHCVSKVTKGGPPSYVELLSCFETMAHARAIRRGHPEHSLKNANPSAGRRPVRISSSSRV